MNKPDWKDAPRWANYLAQDENGAWYWYEQKPKTSIEGSWYALTDCGKVQEASPSPSSKWYETLEPRP